MAPPPAVRAPPALDTFSQAEVLPSDQLKAGWPVLVSEKDWLEKVNGPPTGPLATTPLPGMIWKPSGCVRAMIRLPPEGLPQPVQRS